MWILPKQLHTSPFVPDTAALISDSDEFSQLCAQSLTQRGKDSEFSMGLRSHGTKSRLGVAELSGLSHQELAEIRHWMVASDNRTDELRLLGNGVVPACAERAFRLLVSELMEHQP